MIKKIAWDTFKNTGDINAFMEFKQIENIEKGIEEKGKSLFIRDSILKNNERQ